MDDDKKMKVAAQRMEEKFRMQEEAGGVKLQLVQTLRE